MNSRRLPYVISLLLALILTLLPAAIFLDLAAGTFPKWDNWYQDRTGLRPTFGGPNLPVELRVEQAVFWVCVIPPGVMAEVLFGRPGTYAGPYLAPPGSSFHKEARLPPLALALENGRVALPFWYLTFIALYESSRALTRRLRSSLRSS